ncbi:RrF2 family transcriptional regulator [Actinoplanes sp. RD1]|uniref:RrF2 family transcriptional regulator n=1 Tax=Actinoplanes sp. RD1 TaxID=3064538 RepID=UPI002740338C|nr:Rrf2 family transcriptional regulator [Actinoplanes sp. RD1]
MHISARSDYAVRAMLAVAAGTDTHPARASALAEAQDIPFSFLQGILVDLRHAGLLVSRRGVRGGYILARPPAEISVGDILRAVGGVPEGDGPAATARGAAAEAMRGVWAAAGQAVDRVLDSTTLADLHRRAA